MEVYCVHLLQVELWNNTWPGSTRVQSKLQLHLQNPLVDVVEVELSIQELEKDLFYIQIWNFWTYKEELQDNDGNVVEKECQVHEPNPQHRT